MDREASELDQEAENACRVVKQVCWMLETLPTDKSGSSQHICNTHGRFMYEGIKGCMPVDADYDGLPSMVGPEDWGIWKYGINIVKLGGVLYHLWEHGNKAKCKTMMHEESHGHTRMVQALLMVMEMLAEGGSCGNTFEGLKPIVHDLYMVRLIADVVRGHALHPRRHEILLHEPVDEETQRMRNEGDQRSTWRNMGANEGDTDEPISMTDVEMLKKVVDAHIMTLILHSKPAIGCMVRDPTRVTLPADHDVTDERDIDERTQGASNFSGARGKPGGAVRRMCGYTPAINRVLAPGWSRFPASTSAQHLPLIMAYIWDAIDMNNSDALDEEEARELVRVMLSRPLIALVSVEMLWAEAPKPPPEQIAYSRLELLVACHQAVLKVAESSDAVAKNIWNTLNKNNDDRVEEAEFRLHWNSTVYSCVLDIVAKEARSLVGTLPRLALAVEAARNKKEISAPKAAPVLASRVASRTSEDDFSWGCITRFCTGGSGRSSKKLDAKPMDVRPPPRPLGSSLSSPG
eukprot:gnl/TRDRNA2_/TRDRNA2_170135_c1_seq11.p1 gnl/TRDRNA2_/TRDRNA2_170135_c1~~gnl/TRDRNA2_/TRDRNA2_170135_c1_seq11.p1  ORF type:complete len:519 (+),score=59.20 gnl/TRDRNA2_/TRDRNA2_170135_c1_seq11:114-1670(+)